jgi:GTPase
MKFVDEIEFFVVSGKGGDGCISFRREKFVPRGGPDGGDGGRGGPIIFRATERKNTLVDIRRNKTYRGQNGQPGKGRRMAGAYGKPLVLECPVGTIFFDAKTGDQLADLDAADAEWTIPGGNGGLGNVHFKTSTNRTPRKAKPGQDGTTLHLRAELKLIADVGLLGFPNAGKSTFISRISAARPRVADYPFTTLIPSLGVVDMGDGQSFVVADIPGLIEGASAGVGLGHKFLRHVERCGVYLHLVAPYAPEGEPEALLTALNTELERYDDALLRRAQIVVLSKIDLLSPEEVETHLESLRRASDAPVFAISSVTGSGIKELINELWKHLQEHPPVLISEPVDL